MFFTARKMRPKAAEGSTTSHDKNTEIGGAGALRRYSCSIASVGAASELIALTASNSILLTGLSVARDWSCGGSTTVGRHLHQQYPKREYVGSMGASFRRGFLPGGLKPPLVTIRKC
ncbi:hypothetical protein V6Z94_009023 [Aspergillus fumigatus]